MIAYSNAKINIGLFIKDKRPDGYHNLESIFYPIPLVDLIEILPAQQESFTNTGISIDGENNLILQAVNLLRRDFNIPTISIHIHKQIPLGSGLGGGSSNASFTLKLLNDLFNLKLSEQKLSEYALGLGSDCPFFIYNKPSLVKGRGEIIQPIDFSLKGKYIKLIYPDIHISTREAFEGFKDKSEKWAIDLKSYSTDWMNILSNDFEVGICQKYLEINELKSELIEEGAVYTSLTGTGSSLYGIFDIEPKPLNDNQWVFILD